MQLVHKPYVWSRLLMERFFQRTDVELEQFWQ